MIPEEDQEIFSDDEISIDVPSGSQISYTSTNESVESLQTLETGSTDASSETYDTPRIEKDMEKLREDKKYDDDDAEIDENDVDKDDNDNDDDVDDDDVDNELRVSKDNKSEYSENNASESVSHDQVKIGNNDDMPSGAFNVVKNDAQKITSSTERFKRNKYIKDFKREPTKEIQDDEKVRDRISEEQAMNDLQITQNVIKQNEYNTSGATIASNKECSENGQNNNHNCSDIGNDSAKSEVNLSVSSADESNRNDSPGNISSDSFADDHWEELTIDETGERTIVQHFGDSKTEITIEVSRATETDSSPSLISDSNDSVFNPEPNSITPPEIKCSDGSSDDVSIKSLKSFRSTDKSYDTTIESKCTPSIFVTEDDHDLRTETSDSFVNDSSVHYKAGKEEGNDRGISVSNIVLDPQQGPLSPSTDNFLKTFNIKSINSLNEKRQSLEISRTATSPENSMDTTSQGENFAETNSTERNCGNTRAFSEFKVLTEHSDISDGRSLSPLSDTEYEYYNKRRGSQVKIKLEGRRRQRLSVSECESKHSDDETNDVITMPIPPQVPLLDKREKMEKISFKDFPAKQDFDPAVDETSKNTIIDISERKINNSTETDVNLSHETDSSKSPPKTSNRNIKNINSLNAELIAIYNSDQIHHPIQTKQKKNTNLNVDYKQNKKIILEGSHLLESRDQACETKSFVTDINQQAIKTGGQSETVTGCPRQDFYCDSTFNKFNKLSEDVSRKNGETKSRLLPSSSETGNCQIKMPEKCTMERDMLSHKCEHRQLSLRQNGNKNNEIVALNCSIEQTLASQNKLYQTTILTKTQTYGDFYKRDSLSAPTAREFPRPDMEVSRASNVNTQHLNVPTDKELHLKASKLCLNERSVKEKLKTTFAECQHEIYTKRRNLGKAKTGSENFEMSARARRPREDHIEMAAFGNRDMPARLRRSQSSLTDTARLRSIRKLLKLADDNEEKNEDGNKNADEEMKSFIREIVEGLIHGACSQKIRNVQIAMKSHRCVTSDDDGDEVLGCLLQTSCCGIDPAEFTCDVIDPVDLRPLTKKHEHLISNIIRIYPTPGRKFNSGDELIANIPIAHWYVEKWEELVIRQLDGNGYWENVNSDTSDVIKIDDVKQVYYGVRHVLTEPCTLAVVSRPRVTSETMTGHNLIVNSVVDYRVKMHVFPVSEEKTINMQVVPIEQMSLSEFSEKEENKKACVIISSSPLIQISIDGHDPESLAFDVPYVSVSTRRPEVKSTAVNSSCSPYLRAPDNGSKQSLLSPYLSPTQSPRRVSLASPFVKDLNKRAFHLVQIDEDDEVRVKLLGNNENKTIDVLTSKMEESNDTGDQSLRFSVFDKTARLVALETKGSLEYSDVEKVTRSFVNFIVKHKVTVIISHDPRNVYSILFTAMVDHPHRQSSNATQAYKYFTTNYRKEVQIYEGEIVAISFRGNVDVPDREKLIYSFNGYRGIKRHFDIQVSNPMSQRSLQTYHGALQVFTLKTPRYSEVNRKLTPCNKNGWELAAEFPLLLPKYLKSTPVIVNKAPVSLRFHEPLTVEFIRAICSELINEWTKFAKALGISHARVQAIKQQHRNQVSDKVLMDVIINWMKTQRISQDKVSPLISALRICNRPKLASELAHRFSAQKANRSKTTREKSLQRAFEVICKSSSVIAKWRQLLHHLCQDGDNLVMDVTKEIDENHQDEATKCQNALMHWKSTTPAPSVWKLVDALRANRCTIVADTIVTTESKRK